MKIVNPTARLGEDLAKQHLITKGYAILEQNFRKGYGEIDIVATNNNTLVFVEVKTRTSAEFGSPFEGITRGKVQTLVKTAQFYKLLHPNLPDAMRIDAISVKLLPNGDIKEIEHRENISG